MSPDLVLLIVQVGAALVQALVAAFAKGDTTILSKPLDQILPETLKTTLAKKVADEAAMAKFNTVSDAELANAAKTVRAALTPAVVGLLPAPVAAAAQLLVDRHDPQLPT